MRYLLDTNVCIAWINGKDQRLKEKVLNSSPHELTICSVVKAELVFGAQKSRSRIHNEQVLDTFFANIRSLPFDDEAAWHYGSLRLILEKSGIAIGRHDLLIASIAQQYRLTLVTRNESEFARIPTLNVEVW